jgi:hypothetical protein
MCMHSLKLLYFNLVTGIVNLTRSKADSEKLKEDSVVNRVSREVNYYRTHFFNV